MMDFLADYWMAIVVSSVVVFFASFLAWMVLPHHKADVKAVPNEGNLLGKLNEMNLAPGMYMWPCCENRKDMGTAEFKERFNRGPWGSMTLQSSKPNFARNLISVFIFYLVVGVFVAYLTSHAVAAGGDYLTVFRVSGTAAILAYCFGAIPNAIFWGQPLRFMLTNLADGVVYGLLTAGVFGWLRPTIESATDALNQTGGMIPGN